MHTNALETLWVDLEKHLEKNEKPCVVCGGTDLIDWASERYLKAKKCSNCAMISVNPHFSEAGLKHLYENYFIDRQTEDILRAQRQIVYTIDRDWLLNFIDSGSILDVGCSGGFFLSHFDDSKWTKYGVEFAENSAQHARDEYGIDVQVGNLVDLDFDRQFDIVTMRGTIEHLLDPVAALAKVAEIVKPGGFFFVTATPVGNCFSFDVYRHKWRLFTPLEHIHFFSVENLTSILTEFGFKQRGFHYQYEETPYANPEVDFKRIQDDIKEIEKNGFDNVDLSGPFPGSMMTAIWQRV